MVMRVWPQPGMTGKVAKLLNNRSYLVKRRPAVIIERAGLITGAVGIIKWTPEGVAPLSEAGRRVALCLCKTSYFLDLRPDYLV